MKNYFPSLFSNFNKTGTDEEPHSMPRRPQLMLKGCESGILQSGEQTIDFWEPPFSSHRLTSLLRHLLFPIQSVSNFRRYQRWNKKWCRQLQEELRYFENFFSGNDVKGEAVKWICMGEILRRKLFERVYWNFYNNILPSTILLWMNPIYIY